MGRRASLVKEKGVFIKCGVGQWSSTALESGVVFFAQPRPKRLFLLTSILSSNNVYPNKLPFPQTVPSLKTAITRSRSLMAQSADIVSNDLARPSSDLPILITPSSTICAADIAMPVTSKMVFNIPAPK